MCLNFLDHEGHEVHKGIKRNYIFDILCDPSCYSWLDNQYFFASKDTKLTKLKGFIRLQFKII